jgi:hypothetical protein
MNLEKYLGLPEKKPWGLQGWRPAAQVGGGDGSGRFKMSGFPAWPFDAGRQKTIRAARALATMGTL